MLRLDWLKRVSGLGSPRAARRRLRPFRPGFLRLEPRELLTVTVVAAAGALNFKEGVANNGVNLGQFFSADADKGVAFQVTIDWGDGTTIDSQSVTFPTPLFEVTGSHTYADETAPGKPFNVTVTVTDPSDGSPPASLNDTANVAETDLLSPRTFANFAANEGQTAAANAIFSDANLASPAGNFTATINWGDGKTDQGLPVTVGRGDSQGLLTVNGTHVYADEGTFTSVVTISDVAPGTASASATATATIGDADQLSAATFAPFTAAQGTATATATFNDTYLPAQAGDFTASIDWGDGKTDSGLAVSGGEGLFTVSGQHVYANEGTYTALVTISDDAPGTATATATASATMSEGGILTTTPTPVTGTENVALSNVQVALFTSNDSDSAAGSLMATIDWGDAVTSVGTVTSGGSGLFLVSGSHTFQDEGPYPITVVVRDTDSTATATINTTATIARGPTGGVPGTSAQDFVGHTYRDILLRPADQPSFTALTQEILRGTPFNAVASLLDHSAEYYGQVVDRTYETYLGRAPDAGGRNYWINALEHGLSDEDLSAVLIASDEFFHEAGGTNQSWIDATYLSLLERPADAGGQSVWLAALTQGESRFQVALSMANSPEHERLIVQADYSHFLGRTGGDSEISFWARQLNQGLTDEDLITLLVTSDEYLRRIGA